MLESQDSHIPVVVSEHAIQSFTVVFSDNSILSIVIAYGSAIATEESSMAVAKQYVSSQFMGNVLQRNSSCVDSLDSHDHAVALFDSLDLVGVFIVVDVTQNCKIIEDAVAVDDGLLVDDVIIIALSICNRTHFHLRLSTIFVCDYRLVDVDSELAQTICYRCLLSISYGFTHVCLHRGTC